MNRRQASEGARQRVLDTSLPLPSPDGVAQPSTGSPGESAAEVRPAFELPADWSAIRRGIEPSQTPADWSLAMFAGRFAEISGSEASAALTLVFRLLHEAQRKNEPVAWLAHPSGTFFPPDVAETGVDLKSLAVIWVQESIQAARAADHLLRSGAFGLLVLDLYIDARLPIPVQTRLAGLAKRHDTALLCLTRKETHRPSIGSLVSLRAAATRGAGEQGRYRCEVQVLKDKRKGPGWKYTEVCHAPDGLC